MSFHKSARNIHLDQDGHTLRAELQDSQGNWKAASVDMDKYLGNENGKKLLQVVQ